MKAITKVILDHALIIAAIVFGPYQNAGAVEPTVYGSPFTNSSAKISITSATKIGNYYSDEMQIKGQITGECLVSAGLYVDNKIVQQITLVDSRSGVRTTYFKIDVDASLEPELRVTDCKGSVNQLRIDVLDYR